MERKIKANVTAKAGSFLERPLNSTIRFFKPLKLIP